MKTLKTDLNTFGYDPEELYFHLVNQELLKRHKEKNPAKVIDIETARAKRDAQVAADTTTAKKAA